MTEKLFVSFVTSAALLLFAGNVTARPCIISNEKYASLDFTNALNAWATRTSTSLTIDTRQYLFTQFCTAANEVAEDKNLPLNIIYKLAPQVIQEYLNNEQSEEVGIQNIGSIIRKQLGSSGLFRRTPKQLASLSIEYSKQPDRLYINENEEDPRNNKFLVRPGALSIRATLKGENLCAESKKLRSAESLIVKCGL